MPIFKGYNDLLKGLTYISLFIFCFCFTSCEKEIKIQYIDVEKYVVVNSTFSPNKEFQVNLSYSQNYLDQNTSVEWVENAEIVVLRGDGVYLFTPEYAGEGNYTTSIFPIENQVYRIEIKVEGYPLLTASSRIPTQAIVENVTSTTTDQDGAVKVDFEIQDSEDIDNYYIWEIKQGEFSPDNSNTNLLGIADGGSVESVQNNGRWSKLFLQESDLNAVVSSFLYTDQTGNTENPEAEDPEAEDYYLKVISASSDYYQNLLSIVELENGGLNDGTSSSVVLYKEYHSNIEGGGFGIFAGYNEQFIKL